MTDNRCKSSCSNRHAIHVSCGISPTWQGFQNTVCACLIANESSRLGWLLIAHWLFINFMPWSSWEFAQFIFSVTFPCVIFFSTPPITFLMVRPSVIRVKSRLFSPLPGWSQVLLNRHSKAPVYRHFVKCTAPRGLRSVKSALNPGFGRVKPPRCPGARGAGVLIGWRIINSETTTTIWPGSCEVRWNTSDCSWYRRDFPKPVGRLKSTSLLSSTTFL